MSATKSNWPGFKNCNDCDLEEYQICLKKGRKFRGTSFGTTQKCMQIVEKFEQCERKWYLWQYKKINGEYPAKGSSEYYTCFWKNNASFNNVPDPPFMNQ